MDEAIPLDDKLRIDEAHAAVHAKDSTLKRFAPAMVSYIGIAVMIAVGTIGIGDLEVGVRVLWRPLFAITAIMITTASAQRLGVLDRVAAGLFPHARGSTQRLFFFVFILGASTSAVLNNDSAVLLLLPIVVPLIRYLYPSRPGLIVPFVFAVFSAAGVAPLIVSNPMNMIVAEYAGMNFNAYAVRMLPIAIVGWTVAYQILKFIFRRQLETASEEVAMRPPGRWAPSQIHALILLLGVLATYPIVSYLGGPVWIVALSGAVVGLLLCWRHVGLAPHRLIYQGVSWEILAFLAGVSTFAIGLRNTGLVDWLAQAYTNGGLVGIGTLSALGSAVINNQPMSLINLLAIDAGPGRGLVNILAALIGGDLGPRLLPAGSLAGLLWFASLRRLGVRVSVLKFVGVGAALTLPSLAISLLILHAY